MSNVHQCSKEQRVHVGNNFIICIKSKIFKSVPKHDSEGDHMHAMHGRCNHMESCYRRVNKRGVDSKFKPYLGWGCTLIWDRKFDYSIFLSMQVIYLWCPSNLFREWCGLVRSFTETMKLNNDNKLQRRRSSHMCWACAVDLIGLSQPRKLDLPS